MIRKVAKTSIAHRQIHETNDNKLNQQTQSFLESPPPSFVSISNRKNNNKSESDMDVSESTSPPPHIPSAPSSSSNTSNINFSIKRNPRSIQTKISPITKFKNPFLMNDSSDDSDSDIAKFVISKGRGHTVRKVKKKKKKNGKKNGKKKINEFTWDGFDGIDSLKTKTKIKQDTSELNEISRILERKKRFELQQSQNTNTNTNTNDTSRTFMTRKGGNNSNNNKRLSRDLQQMMDWQEKKIIGTCTKVEKDYLRLTSEPQPFEVRTLDTLKKAFDLLMIRWRRKNKKDYLYVGGQFKSLRQDLRVQHIRNEFSVKVYQENAKICLEVGDLSEYNQCQGQLKELYKEMELFGETYIEFLSYRLLYEAVTKNFHAVSTMIKVEKQYCKGTEIKNTLKIISAIQRTDYYTFFKVYKQLRYHAQCILDQIIYKFRYQTLCRISVSYCPSKYPVSQLTKAIGFDDENECIEYLKNAGCILIKSNNNKIMLNCKDSRGKIKEFTPKSQDDELGVTHGSVYHSKDQEEQTINKFLRKK